MKISVFGLGYVGIVSAVCLCELGNKVIGVDINEDKVNTLNNMQSPILESGVKELVKKHVSTGNLSGTTDHQKAISESEVGIICVGTPSGKNGGLDLSHVKNVTEQIGDSIVGKKKYTLIYRSTMLPGSLEREMIPILEKKAGKNLNGNIEIFYNPEFLREGSAIKDFFSPPKTVIGTLKNQSLDIPLKLYEKINAPTFIVSLREAEMVKYVDNVFHALKVTFANEIGRISKELNLDSRKIMEIFLSDTKLNISPYYLKPGFAFGGSCLPKDVRALNYFARKNDIEIPVISNILKSNQSHIEFLIEKILSKGKKKIGILGIAFKNGTDDLRESPIIEVAEILLGKGHEIKIYDKFVNISKLIGKNREYLLKKLPHIMKLMVSNSHEAIKNSEIILLSNKNEEYVNSILKFGDGKVVFDLCNGLEGKKGNFFYEGICW